MKKVLVLLLCLCMVLPALATAGGSALEPVTLRFIFLGDKRAATDEVWDAIADKYRDVLNADFDVQFIPMDDYKQKLLVMAAAGESWDMNYCGAWLGYHQMTAMDAYMDLSSLMPEYAPDLYKLYQEVGAIDSMTHKGKLIALPWTMGKLNNRTNIMWRADLAKEAGISVDPAAIDTFEDAYEVLAQLHAAYPDRYIIEYASRDSFLLKYSLVDIGNNMVVDLKAGDHKVMPIEQTQAYLEFAMAAEKLQNDGLIWKDILNDKTDKNTLINQGQLIAKWGTYEFARSARTFVEDGAYWEYAFLYADGLSPNRSPLGNIVAISDTSENPERTLMFLNLLQNDKELYDLVHYGIEGTTYVLSGEEAVYPEGMNGASSNYMGWGGRWALWSPEFMRPDYTYYKDFWHEENFFAESNPNNVVSPYDGFSLDTEDISIELAERDQVHIDAHKLIEVGLAGDAQTAVNSLIENQKANAEIIVKEAQAQVDAYIAGK